MRTAQLQEDGDELRVAQDVALQMMLPLVTRKLLCRRLRPARVEVAQHDLADETQLQVAQHTARPCPQRSSLPS